MDIDTLVADTFTAHEYLAPDEFAVMAAVRKRTQRRSLAQPLAVAAGITVAATAAVVVGATMTRPAVPADSQPQLNPAASSTKARAGIAPLTMPFDLGWLPEGTAHTFARRGPVTEPGRQAAASQYGEYGLTVTTPSTTALNITVQSGRASLDGVQFKSGPGVQVPINGRAGVESANSGGPGGYELYFVGQAGAVMYVGVSGAEGSTVPADQLVAVGRKVAENVRQPGTTRVDPTFGVGYVPAGMRVRGFNVQQGLDLTGDPSTYYEVGTATEPDAAIAVGTNVAGRPKGNPGPAVQRRETLLADENGHHILYVLNADHGRSVRIAGRVDFAELYKIANGLVLPN